MNIPMGPKVGVDGIKLSLGVVAILAIVVYLVFMRK